MQRTSPGSGDLRSSRSQRLDRPLLFRRIALDAAATVDDLRIACGHTYRLHDGHDRQRLALAPHFGAGPSRGPAQLVPLAVYDDGV